ncbi:MAG: hypothetical protein WC243_01875 [Patescibacteria group bacterium]|jgi:hypothetical protein
MAKIFWQIVILSFFAFFLSWLVAYKTGLNTLAIQSEDTLPAMFLPVSIIKDDTMYADKYYETIKEKYPHPDDKSFEKGLTPFYFKKVGEHYVSAFTLVSGLLSVPVYFLPLMLGLPVTFENITFLAHIASSLIVAFSGGFMYLLLKKHFALDGKKALLITGVYLFGTVNLSMISQALWQHGSLQLFTILGLYFLYEKRWLWTSFTLGLAVLSRPTAALFVPFLFLVVLYFTKNLRFVPKILLGLVPVVLFFFWYNKTFYGDISNQGYASQIFTEWRGRFPEGFFGLWLSPSKGILIYSPIFVFSLIGFVMALKQRKIEYFLYFCIIFLYTMLMGRWKHWYGGYSYGYRMASDILPFLTLLLVPFVGSVHFLKFKGVFLMLFAVSVLMQIIGIVFFDGIWHGIYDRGFVDTKWLWSVKDSELVFNVRRVLTKFGLLSKACEVCMNVGNSSETV